MKLELISGSLNMPRSRPFSAIPPPFGNSAVPRRGYMHYWRKNAPIQPVPPDTAPTLETKAAARPAQKRRALRLDILLVGSAAFLLGLFIQTHFKARPVADSAPVPPVKTSPPAVSAHADSAASAVQRPPPAP